jgi:hypothetical protein
MTTPRVHLSPRPVLWKVLGVVRRFINDHTHP